jgi:type IV pilus assembly protein PilP
MWGIVPHTECGALYPDLEKLEVSCKTLLSVKKANMGEKNNNHIFEDLSNTLGQGFSAENLSTPDDCRMSEKALLYGAGELEPDEIDEFCAHLQHCRFCLNLILDLRLADEEARESAGQPALVLPALAEALAKSPRREPKRTLMQILSATIGKLYSFFSFPKMLVPLATACLVFFVMQSALKDQDTARRPTTIRYRIVVPKQSIATPAKPLSISPDEKVFNQSAPSKKQAPSQPQETIYSVDPVLAERSGSSPVARKQKMRTPHSRLEKLALGRLRLVGIVFTPEGNKAMVEDPSGKGHVLAVGSYIGTNGGKVIRIDKDRIIIAEETEDESGKASIKEVALKLVIKTSENPTPDGLKEGLP